MPRDATRVVTGGVLQVPTHIDGLLGSFPYKTYNLKGSAGGLQGAQSLCFPWNDALSYRMGKDRDSCIGGHIG